MAKAISLIPKLVEELRKSENLPFEIKLHNCYKKIPQCSEHHGEIILRSYDKVTCTWHVIYNFVHEKDPPHEHNHDATIVQKHLENSFKRGFLGKKFLKDMTSSRKQEKITIRVSNPEKQRLLSKANEENLSPSDYVRKM